MRIQLAKQTRQSPVGKKDQWPGVLVFENSPEGIMISEYARIRILTLRVRWKSSRVGQIWSQIEKFFLLRNLECGLADFYGHYSSRDLHICGGAGLNGGSRWLFKV